MVKFGFELELNNHQYIRKDILTEVVGIKDPGIFIDYKLTFERHMSNMVAKANKILGSLLRSRSPLKNDRTLMKLFFTLVRSVLEHESVI